MTAPTCPLCDAPVPASVVSGPPTTVFRCEKCNKVLTWRNGKAMASASAMRAKTEKAPGTWAGPTPPPAPSPLPASGAPTLVGPDPAQAATQLVGALPGSGSSDGKTVLEQVPAKPPASAGPTLKPGLPLAEVLTSPEMPAIRLPEELPQPAPPGLSRLESAGPQPAGPSVFRKHKVPIGAALGLLVVALIGFAVFGGGDSKEGEAAKPTAAEAANDAPAKEPADKAPDQPADKPPPATDDAAEKEAAEKTTKEAAVDAELAKREAEKAAKDEAARVAQEKRDAEKAAKEEAARAAQQKRDAEKAAREAAAKEAADKRDAEKAAKEAAAKEAADKRAAEKAAKEAAAKEAADKRAAEKAAKAEAAAAARAEAAKTAPARKSEAAPAKPPPGPTLDGKPVVLDYDDGPDKKTVVPAGVAAEVQRARAAYQAGNKKLNAKDPAGAIDSYRAALKAYPGYVGAYRGIGLALVKQKENAKAIAVFKLYLKNAPGAKDAALIKKVIAKLENG